MYARADGLLSTKKKKKKSNSFRVVPAHQLSSCDVGGGPGAGGGRGLTAAHRCPFHSQAENDKFNKLKTPLWSTYGIKHT